MTTERSDSGGVPESTTLRVAAFTRQGLWPAAIAFVAAWHRRVIAVPEAWRRNVSRTSRPHPPPGSLARDPYVRLALGLLALASVPYLFPLLSTETMVHYSATYVDLPFLALVIAATVRCFRVSVDKGERRFWALLSVAFLCSIALEFLNLAFTDWSSWGVATDLVNSLPYLAAYAAIAIALENCPHVRPARLSRRLRAFDRVGAFVFLFFLLLYFTILPTILDSNTYWTSSLVLFVVLDAYIATRLATLYRKAMDPAWRSVYSWLLFASLLWVAVDTVYLLAWMEIIPDFESTLILDGAWMLSLTATIVAARTGDYKPHENANQLALPGKPLGTGALVVYAVAAPVLHLVLYRFGWTDPVLRPARELLVVVFSLALAALAIAYQQLLRREHQRLALEESRVQEELEQHAYHDRLTGLPNRIRFSEHLRRALGHGRRTQGKFAVLYCDLDRFKAINDSLGHEAGDQVLVAVVARLRNAVRGFDVLARSRDDEFTVLVQGVFSAADAARSAARLLASLSAPLEVAGRTHVVTTSIGIALYPQDGEDEITLLRHADTAMYQAKLEGRNAYKIFTPTMNERLGI